MKYSHYKIPLLSSPRLFGYCAFGAAGALSVSIGYYRLKNRNNLESSSTPSTMDQHHNSSISPHQFLQSANLHPLDFVQLCRLALDGVDISSFVETQPITLLGTLKCEEVEKFLLKSNLLRTVLIGFFYHMPSIYTEEDLFYASEIEQDYRFEERLKSSREEKRILELLSQLLLQSEINYNPKGSPIPIMDNAIIGPEELARLLINLVDKYRTTNKPILLMSLKILANTVGSSKECAQLIVESDWLPLLSSMLKTPKHDEERVLAHKILHNALHGLGYENLEMPPHLYELHRPSSSQTPPKLDIVLIHGLRGSAFRTWRQKEQAKQKTTLFWPKDWLAVDVTEPIRIIALDYSSRFFRFKKSLETMSARSERLVNELEKAGIGDRPIVFICHSMGGLLVKQLLISSEALLSKTVGILFMATPHLGTPVASQLGPYFIRPSNDILFLQPNSVQNKELADRFKMIADQIPLIATMLECEKTPVWGRKMIESHHQVCKPESRESNAYRIALNFVNDALQHLKVK